GPGSQSRRPCVGTLSGALVRDQPLRTPITLREMSMRRQSRRELLLHTGRAGIATAGLAMLAGCGIAGTDRLLPASVSGGDRLETTTIRLVQIPTICQAPEYVVADLMRAEGFTQVEYVKKGGTKDIEGALASGEADINMHFAAPLVLRIDAGDPL